MPKALLALALGDLGREALKVAAGLVLAVLIALAFAVSSLMTFFGAAAPGQTIAGTYLDEIPPGQLPVMQQAATLCGLPWQVLAAVAKVESNLGRNMATSSAGAIGYGQFLPSSWAAFGVDGDGDGDKDPYDFRDALPSMAQYLCTFGGAEDLRGALWAYNHADWYVDQVLAVAVRYGHLAPGVQSNQVADLARAQIGTPYVWGGSSPDGFDCSGLVQWVHLQLGIALPRTAQQQFDATIRLSPEELQPGDLVFFAYTYPSVEPITHVGIYAGNGMMINAPAEGDVVREMAVFTGYWGDHFAGAGRVPR